MLKAEIVIPCSQQGREGGACPVGPSFYKPRKGRTERKWGKGDPVCPGNPRGGRVGRMVQIQEVRGTQNHSLKMSFRGRTGLKEKKIIA